MTSNILNNISTIDLNKYFTNIDFNVLNNDNFDDKSNNKFTKVNNRFNKSCCQSCGGTEFSNDYSLGIVICTNPECGQVNDNIMDCNPEWKQFDDDDKKGGRCGAPINKLLPLSSIGTNIVGFGKSRLETLHRWNSMPYKERSLNNVFKIISNACQKNGILKCIEDDAKIMYKSLSESKHIDGKNGGKFIITRGRNRLSIIAACLFFACRRKGMTRTPKEIAKFFDINYLEMNRGCKNFIKLIKTKQFNIGTSKAEHFIKRHCNKLGICTELTNQAVQISKNLDRLNLASQHTPNSVAAASILLMAELNGLKSITKKKLKDKFSLSDITIAKTYKKIAPYKDILSDDSAVTEILEKINADSQKEKIPIEVLERMKKFGIIPESNNDVIIKNNDDILDEDFELDLDDNNPIDHDEQMEEFENLIQQTKLSTLEKNISIFEDLLNTSKKIINENKIRLFKLKSTIL